MQASGKALTQPGKPDMHYTILIYESPAELALRTDERKRDAYWGGIPPYFKAVHDAGIFVAGSGLQPPETATTLTVRDGRRQVQDGPYAETKEQLAGYFIVDVPDRETALDWAARFPHVEGKTFEVRPNLPPMH